MLSSSRIGSKKTSFERAFECTSYYFVKLDFSVPSSKSQPDRFGLQLCGSLVIPEHIRLRFSKTDVVWSKASRSSMTKPRGNSRTAVFCLCKWDHLDNNGQLDVFDQLKDD